MSAPPLALVQPLRWWHLGAAHALEQQLFPTDAWSLGLFWSELAGVPTQRHYLAALPPDRRKFPLLGYAGLAWAGSTADVQTVAVHPQWQGHGIGAALLQGLVEHAARRACEAVMLEVREDNQAGLALYQRHGFTHLHTRPGYYDAGRTDALILRKLLT